MRITKVTCDGCGRDLTTRTNCEDYRLLLTPESKPGSGAGFYTAMAISPALEREHHFCGLTCLDVWRGREKHCESSMRAKADLWKEEHGHRDANGHINSWRSASEDVRTKWHEESRADALVAFPMKHQ